MTSRQHHNDLNANTNPREKFKKIFFWKNLKKISRKGYPKWPWFRSGDSPSILFTFWKFTAQKTPFLRFFRFCTFLCTFSEFSACSSYYVHIFIPFRTIIYAIYRYYNLKLWLLTIYLIDSQIVSAYISKMLLK